MKRKDPEHTVMFWRVLSAALAIMLAAQSFNIITGTAQ
jgi:hypothetical protein